MTISLLPAILILLLALINYVVFPLLILLKKRDPWLTVALILFNVGIGSWQIALIYFNFFNDTLLAHKFAFVSALLGLWGMLGLSFGYPDKKIAGHRKIIYLLTGLLFLVEIGFILGSNLIVQAYLLPEKEVIFGPFRSLLLVPLGVGLLASAGIFAFRYITESRELFNDNYNYTAMTIRNAH